MTGTPTDTRSAVRQNGTAIRVIREKDGWTQRALARAVGIRPATLCAIEAEDASAQMDTLKALAHAMHCPVDAILRRCEPVRAAAKAEPEPQGAAAA